MAVSVAIDAAAAIEAAAMVHGAMPVSEVGICAFAHFRPTTTSTRVMFPEKDGGVGGAQHKEERPMRRARTYGVVIPQRL